MKKADIYPGALIRNGNGGARYILGIYRRDDGSEGVNYRTLTGRKGLSEYNRHHELGTYGHCELGSLVRWGKTSQNAFPESDLVFHYTAEGHQGSMVAKSPWQARAYLHWSTKVLTMWYDQGGTPCQVWDQETQQVVNWSDDPVRGSVA